MGRFIGVSATCGQDFRRIWPRQHGRLPHSRRPARSGSARWRNSLHLGAQGGVGGPSTPACRPFVTALGSSIATSRLQEALQSWVTLQLVNLAPGGARILNKGTDFYSGARLALKVWIGSHGCCARCCKLNVCRTSHRCVSYVWTGFQGHSATATWPLALTPHTLPVAGVAGSDMHKGCWRPWHTCLPAVFDGFEHQHSCLRSAAGCANAVLHDHR